MKESLLCYVPNTEEDCVYTILYSYGKENKGETSHLLQIRLEEHRRAVLRGDIIKSGIADHVYREKGIISPSGMKRKYWKRKNTEELDV